MINTFKFSKGLIISIVYNVIILTLVQCDGSDTEDNNEPPVLDYEPVSINDKNYFEYHFKSTYPGQFKLNPKSYFASKYNCAYLALPDLHSKTKDTELDYFFYKGKFLEKKKKYEISLFRLKNHYNRMISFESELDNTIEKTYEATKNAYTAVDNFEKKEGGTEKELENLKTIAIDNYLNNQMPITTVDSTISVKYDGIDFYYVLKNYELYIDPTEKIFYRSNIIKEEIESLKIDLCHSLSEIEYDEIYFLYTLLPNKDDKCENYEEMKILFTLKFQESFLNPLLTYKYENFLIPKVENDTNSYHNTCNKMKSKFVVNNENYMSYLIRLKALGYIGIHQDNHKFMFGVRKKNYYPSVNGSTSSTSYITDMDILEEDFEREELQPIENMEKQLQPNENVPDLILL